MNWKQKGFIFLLAWLLIWITVSVLLTDAWWFIYCVVAPVIIVIAIAIIIFLIACLKVAYDDLGEQ